MENSFKHTPGKWMPNSNKYQVVTESSGGAQVIAHVNNISEEERIATARLIAATPLMYEA